MVKAKIIKAVVATVSKIRDQVEMLQEEINWALEDADRNKKDNQKLNKLLKSGELHDLGLKCRNA